MKKFLINFIIILFAIALTFCSMPYVYMYIVFASMYTNHSIILYLNFFLAVTIYAYFWTNIVWYVSNRKFLKKKGQYTFIVVAFSCFAVVGGIKAYDAYQNSFAKVETEVDLEKYQPFQSNLLATLDGESTLKIEEPLLNLDGATAFYPMYASFVQAIYPQKEYFPYDSEVVCSTTPSAYLRLLSQAGWDWMPVADVIFVFGPSQEQLLEFEEKDESLEMTPIGKESFVFFVNADNPVNSLTQQQVRDIYSGKITNWKEVGGRNESIKAYQRPEGSGSQTALQKMMKDTPIMTPIEEDVVEGMGGIISITSEYRNRNNAIGYSFRYFTEEMINNKEIKLLQIDGIEPNNQNIRDNAYPYIYPFYAIHLKSNQNKQIPPLLEWLVSNQGKELIEKSGYVAYENVV